MPTSEALLAQLSTRKQVVFAYLIVATSLVAIEGAARLWLRIAAGPHAGGSA